MEMLTDGFTIIDEFDQTTAANKTTNVWENKTYSAEHIHQRTDVMAKWINFIKTKLKGGMS